IEPVHVYPSQGSYTVTLTSSDKLNVESVFELEILLEEPSAFIPPILESGFEDGQLEGGLGDGRDSWRNSDLGGVIQITSSPVASGSQAAKLTGDPGDQRIGYQLLTVTENTNYDVTFSYTMRPDPVGFLTVSILDGPVTSHEEAIAATIGSKTVNDQSNPDVFVQEIVSFNSGPNTEIAIYFFNDGSVETRLDDFSIDIGSSGPLPPSAGFTFDVDDSDWRQVSFTNTSLNASSYQWDFGDGSSSTDVSPTHIYDGEGEYNVTLTASNSEGQSASSSALVMISEPSDVIINNPSFDDEPIRDDNRIAWRNEELEADADIVFGESSYVLQTSNEARTGSYAGKLPTQENSNDPRRWLYQAITVEPNTDYTISGWIKNKDAGVGSTVTFSIYDAPFSNASNIGNSDAIIASEDFDETTGHDTNQWTEATISFNSGSSAEIVLFITNDFTLNGDPVDQESETFLDDFSISE
ncbi:MAG: PKD domain-containing protein, partial [Bacteroidota bacterium]